MVVPTGLVSGSRRASSSFAQRIAERNVNNFTSGALAPRFEEGRDRDAQKEHELLSRVRGLPDGDGTAREVKQMIDRASTFIRHRKYPKYGMESRYFLYKRALLREADRLVQADERKQRDDIFHLTFGRAPRGGAYPSGRHRAHPRRSEEFRSFQAPTPPRVVTSDGEARSYRRDDLPPGALAGLAISAGAVERRARAMEDIAQADLDAGDILVTSCTDRAGRLPGAPDLSRTTQLF